MRLKKLRLSVKDKNLIENTTGKILYLRNSFGLNQEQIQKLLFQGKQNALVYLERNRLGQKLNIFEENNLFLALKEMQDALNLKKIPRRIECYDISHLSGTFVYGSLVTFIDGKPEKKLYKIFRCKALNNDFENHKNVLTRRLERFLAEMQSEENKKNLKWGLPDLIIVDGGKGQLSSDFQAISDFLNRNKIKEFTPEIISIAKKNEEIFTLNNQHGLILSGNLKFLVQRIRDESHRFAIQNSRKAKLKTAKRSKLDAIPGIGQKTKEKLLRVFGSTENLSHQVLINPELVSECVGTAMTLKLKKYFGF